MPNYRIQTSESHDYFIEYHFASVQKAKNFFCTKILNLDYSDRDNFTRSANYFEEMGVLLSSYSNEKCYAIGSLSQSAYDLYKWGKSVSEYSKRTNREIIGSEDFLNSIDKRCDALLNVLKTKVADHNNIFMPHICCEADPFAQSSNKFSCDKDNQGYIAMLEENGCSQDEGVCDVIGGRYTIFASDEL